MKGSQRIGWDPSAKRLRSWVFDSEGGFGEGVWSKSGNQWIAKMTGVTSDGKTASSTNVITARLQGPRDAAVARSDRRRGSRARRGAVSDCPQTSHAKVTRNTAPKFRQEENSMRRLTSIAVVVVVGSLLSPHAFAGRGGDGGGGRAAGAAAAARAAGGAVRRPSRGCSCCPSWRCSAARAGGQLCPSWSRSAARAGAAGGAGGAVGAGRSVAGHTPSFSTPRSPANASRPNPVARPSLPQTGAGNRPILGNPPVVGDRQGSETDQALQIDRALAIGRLLATGQAE